MSKIIEQLETAQLKKDIPDFRPGDTVVVQVKVKEGNRERLQAFEGVVIAKRNRGLNSAFTVRKVSYGEGVERVFQTHSPLIASIKVKRRGDVRKAKLYYLRERSGRAARIKEKLNFKEKSTEAASAAAMETEALAAAAEEAVQAQVEEEAKAAAEAAKTEAVKSTESAEAPQTDTPSKPSEKQEATSKTEAKSKNESSSEKTEKAE